MNFLVKHLKDAKKASGSNEPITIRDYFKHAIISCKEGCLLIYAAFASFVHGIFPWWYGFELIQWQIDMLKRLKKGLPHLKVWEQIEFKDEEDK